MKTTAELEKEIADLKARVALQDKTIERLLALPSTVPGPAQYVPMPCGLPHYPCTRPHAYEYIPTYPYAQPIPGGWPYGTITVANTGPNPTNAANTMYFDAASSVNIGGTQLAAPLPMGVMAAQYAMAQS